MKKLLIFLSISCTTLILIFLLDSQSKLEKLRIKSIFFRKGEKLSVAAKTFEKAIQESGNDWFVIVDPRISEKMADVNFGGTGNANNMAYIIAKTYDAKSIVYEKNRLILYMPK
jgi:hypothetical protein